ncbi:MAG TPA: hypothetical protein VNL16_08745 [Chloroflexota bacterium]|nr:hypothetical protein [Chloroflexota bacterium]
MLTFGRRYTYTSAGGAGARPSRAALDRGGTRLTPEPIALPARFVDSPLYRRWSGDGQKLYFWLRARVDEDTPLAPDDYRQLRGEGYLATYATAEELMDRAIDCSRNTLTKLIRDLADLGVLEVRPARRGYVFVLGERLSATTRADRRPLDVEVFYLDQLVSSAADESGPRPLADDAPTTLR